MPKARRGGPPGPREIGRHCSNASRTSKRLLSQQGLSIRAVNPRDYLDPAKRAPERQVWFRVVGRLPDDQALHRCLLTYVSDYHLLATATLPHGVPFLELQLASIDHAIWFHRDLRVDDWLLYAMKARAHRCTRILSRIDLHAGLRLVAVLPRRADPPDALDEARRQPRSARQVQRYNCSRVVDRNAQERDCTLRVHPRR